MANPPTKYPNPVDQVDAMTGEITKEGIRGYEPAVLPLTAIMLDPPLLVKALNGKGGLTKGALYYATAVTMDGKVSLMRFGLASMEDFVEMLPTPRGNATPKP